MLAIDTPLREAGLGWFRRAAEVAPLTPDPINPVVPLIDPLARMFGAPEQDPPPPEIFDAAVGDPHPWVSARRPGWSSRGRSPPPNGSA